MHRSISTNLPLTTLNDDEIAMQETVSRLVQQEIAPHVREMEKAGRLKDSVLDALFKNGVSIQFLLSKRTL